jgi:excisionase family DNA binding protein
VEGGNTPPGEKAKNQMTQDTELLFKSEMLTPDETATLLKISADELRDLRRRKRLAFVKLGYRTIRFRLQDLEAFIQRYRVAAIGEPVQ